jgi:hypothetical protein
MKIEQGDDAMHTKTSPNLLPSASIFTGEASLIADEADYRISRLSEEAARQRLAGPRDGLRQHVGHALMALGRAIHGVEPELRGRPVLDPR